MYLWVLAYSLQKCACLLHSLWLSESFILLCVSLCVVFSCILAAPWAVARQAPLSTGFSRQESWNGLLFPPPGDFPDPGLEPTSPALAGGFSTAELPGNPQELETYN